MLERLVKNIGRKITPIVLAGTLLLGFGCATYRTMSPSLIQPVTPIERPIERPIDYSELTWQEAIKYVQTPEQAQGYLDNHLHFYDEGRAESFALNHTDGTGRCIDYAIAAAALLSDDGYPQNFLSMIADDGAHAVFLYRQPSGYGALGNTPLEPIYSSVQSLVQAFESVYGWKFDKFNIVDLNATFPNNEILDSDQNLELGARTDKPYIKVRPAP